MKVQIIDYGMGNLKSVRRAFETCGAEVSIVDHPGNLSQGCRTVLPGVGSFHDGMVNLTRSGFRDALLELVDRNTAPFLGICLGMQMMASIGHENGISEGLGMIPGVVERIIPTDESCRVPHVGWNDIWRVHDHPLLTGIPDGADFYFVHSYHFIASDSNDIIAKTPYGTDLSSVIGKGHVVGVQFHPEKSQKYGLQLIRNFLGM